MRMIDFDYCMECISKVEQQCREKKREFTVKANECIQAVLQTLNNYNQELEATVKQCREIKGKLVSPRTRYETFSRWVNVVETQNVQETIQETLSPNIKSHFEGFQKQLSFFLTPEAIEGLGLSKDLQNFLGSPESFTCFEKPITNNLELKFFIHALPESQLKSLNFEGNKIGDEGAQELAKVLPSCQISHLNLTGNSITEKGAVALASAIPGSLVTSVNLASNKVGFNGAEAIANALVGSEVTHLDLAYNEIGAEGLRPLASALAHCKLSYLDLTLNRIGGKGMKTLADALPSSQLTNLCLKDNGIGIKGAKELVSVLPKCQLTALNLERNPLGEEVKKALEDLRPKMTDLLY